MSESSQRSIRLADDTSCPIAPEPTHLCIGAEEHDVGPGEGWCIPTGVEHGAKIPADSVAVEVFSPVREDSLPQTRKVSPPSQA